MEFNMQFTVESTKTQPEITQHGKKMLAYIFSGNLPLMKRKIVIAKRSFEIAVTIVDPGAMKMK